MRQRLSMQTKEKEKYYAYDNRHLTVVLLRAIVEREDGKFCVGITSSTQLPAATAALHGASSDSLVTNCHLTRVHSPIHRKIYDNSRCIFPNLPCQRRCPKLIRSPYWLLRYHNPEQPPTHLPLKVLI